MAIKRLQGEKEKELGIYYEFNTADQPLGEGGMGKVYRGRQVDEKTGTAKDVAIKFLYSDLPENVIERARREASITLNNDNLVRMLGFFEIEDRLPDGTTVSRYHVVSELLHGVMLDDLIHGKTTDSEGNEIPFAQELYKEYFNDPYHFSIFIIKNVLSGLIAMHDAGYIHRDIDPTNIMITSDRHVKLIDFGIAKQLVSLSTFDRSLTSTGQFIGKASYAAPELVLGDIKNQNTSTDTYSVGILLFLCLVGHLPFEGTDNEVMGMQLRGKIPAQLIKQSAMRRIILKATAKNQSARYQSAAEFRVALEQISTLPYPEPHIQLKRVGRVAVPVVAALIVVMAIVMMCKPSGSEGGAAGSDAAGGAVPGSYAAILQELRSPEQALQGLAALDSLANTGDAEATYLLSRLYFVSKSANDYRPDSIKQMQEATGIACDFKKAHELLLQTVKLNADDYRALYELGCDYLGGPARTDAAKRDIDQAEKYLRKALEAVKKAGDTDFENRISEKLRILEE